MDPKLNPSTRGSHHGAGVNLSGVSVELPPPGVSVNLSAPGVSVGSALKQQQWEEVGGATLCSSSSSTLLQLNTFVIMLTLVVSTLSQFTLHCNLHFKQHSVPALRRQLHTMHCNSQLAPNYIETCIVSLALRQLRCSSIPSHDFLVCSTQSLP